MIKAEWTNKDSLDLQSTCNQLATNLQLTEEDNISRADAVEAVLGLTQLNGRVPTDSVIFQIKALPSADRPTIVRCKECRHYEKFNYEAPSGYDGWCNTPVIYTDGHYTNALHFCSWGERQCNYFGERRQK